MKKALLFISITILLYSCSKNDDLNTDVVWDPDTSLKIAEFHILNSSGNVSTKYIFNSLGLLTEIHNNGVNTILYYSYDSNYRIVEIKTTNFIGVELDNKPITYDTNGRLVSIGTRDFVHQGEGSYAGDLYISPYNNYPPDPDGGPEEYDIYYKNYYTVTEGYPLYFCEFIGARTIYGEDYYDSGTCSNNARHYIVYDGDNVTRDTYYDSHIYSHDTHINPLYSSLSNINYLMAFLDSHGYYGNHNHLISKNNFTGYTLSDPTRVELEYQYNSEGLPISSYKRSYYGTTLEYEGEFAKYYYKGDPIDQ